MMKRLSLTILFCLVLSGCIFDPVFDTSSWDAYQQSIDAINAKLSNDDSRRLNVALKYLLFETMPTVSVEGSLLTRVGASPNIANPYLILAQLGPKINGRSAAEVVANLSLKLDAEIAAMEARKPGDVLGTVEVFSPSYYWRRSGYLAQPVIEFSVRNDGKIPISRIYFRMSLMTPGRSIPWVSQMFVQEFKGGLEPREKREINIQALSGQWRDPQLQYLPKAELKVMVTNFSNVNGVMVVAFDSERLELERRVRAELN
jgi:uncharacterized protein DUF6694